MTFVLNFLRHPIQIWMAFGNQNVIAWNFCHEKLLIGQDIISMITFMNSPVGFGGEGGLAVS